MVVYKVMKKVGKITEARKAVREFKLCPIVSDALYEGKVAMKRDAKIVSEKEKLAKEGQQRLRRVANAQSKKPGISDRWTPNAKALANTQAKIKQNQKDREDRTANTNGTNGSTNGELVKKESSTAKPIRQARARAQAGKPIKKGTAKMVASDPGQDLATATDAADKL